MSASVDEIFFTQMTVALFELVLDILVLLAPENKSRASWAALFRRVSELWSFVSGLNSAPVPQIRWQGRQKEPQQNVLALTPADMRSFVPEREGLFLVCYLLGAGSAEAGGTAEPSVIAVRTCDIYEEGKVRVELDWFVPFREAPAYSRRRRGPQPSSLAAPRVLLRSNSDNNLSVCVGTTDVAPGLSVCVGSPDAASRSLSPQLLQQMQRNPNGTVRTGGHGNKHQTNTRSPSLSRLGEEQRRHQLRAFYNVASRQLHRKEIQVQAPRGQARDNSREDDFPRVRKKPRAEPGLSGEPILLWSIPEEERKTELTRKGRKGGDSLIHPGGSSCKDRAGPSVHDQCRMLVALLWALQNQGRKPTVEMML
ncbi:hypothetical protein NFI96_031797 [Prochilodus magdalenae]|nr:hypothetical protein NFI96_031797 [Prochilodus magdalenae]